MKLASVLFMLAWMTVLPACATPSPSPSPSATPSRPATLQTMTLRDLPLFPNSVELKPGEEHLADKLAALAKNDATLQSALGVGIAERRVFALPKDTAPDATRKFYDDKLLPAGWKSETVKSTLLERVSQLTDVSAYQVVVWTRGTQRLAIVQAASPGFLELFVTVEVV